MYKCETKFCCFDDIFKSNTRDNNIFFFMQESPTGTIDLFVKIMFKI